jgi:hypothetical protein
VLTVVKAAGQTQNWPVMLEVSAWYAAWTSRGSWRVNIAGMALGHFALHVRTSCDHNWQLWLRWVNGTLLDSARVECIRASTLKHETAGCQHYNWRTGTASGHALYAARLVGPQLTQ